MKKPLFSICVLIAILTFSSCKRECDEVNYRGCYVCSKASSIFEICEEDYDDFDKPQKAFNAAINLAEADGYECKEN